MKVVLHKNFKKKFKKLSPKIKQKFFQMVDLFLEDKFNRILNNHSVDAVYPGWRSINITGDVRALYEERSESQVLFMRIGTHPELYG